MLYVFRTDASIFYMPKLVSQIKKLNLAVNTGVIALTLLPESIKVLISLA